VFRWTTAGAVIGVAAVAAVASCKHAYDLCAGARGGRVDGPARPADYAWSYLREFDGAARLGAPQGPGASIGEVVPGLGIAATLAANVAPPWLVPR
jgi:hypothetical protein